MAQDGIKRGCASESHSALSLDFAGHPSVSLETPKESVRHLGKSLGKVLLRGIISQAIQGDATTSEAPERIFRVNGVLDLTGLTRSMLYRKTEPGECDGDGP